MPEEDIKEKILNLQQQERELLLLRDKNSEHLANLKNECSEMEMNLKQQQNYYEDLGQQTQTLENKIKGTVRILDDVMRLFEDITKYRITLAEKMHCDDQRLDALTNKLREAEQVCQHAERKYGNVYQQLRLREEELIKVENHVENLKTKKLDLAKELSAMKHFVAKKEKSVEHKSEAYMEKITSALKYIEEKERQSAEYEQDAFQCQKLISDRADELSELIEKRNAMKLIMERMYVDLQP